MYFVETPYICIMKITGFTAEHHYRNSHVYQMDCMELMRQTPDNYFDLGVVDPPYGIGEDGSKNHTRGGAFGGKKNSKSKAMVPAKNYKAFSGNDKAPESEDYFKELFRVTKNQIVWGANHFISKLPFDSPAWIVWDKENGESDFADCELAYTSFNCSVRKFSFKWHGMLQGNMANKEIRIHPTQKPIALYSWIFDNYAKPGWRILDTHLGSQSSRIAAYKKGFEFWATELDADYFNEGNERFMKAVKMPLFENLPPEQLQMF